MADPLGTLLAVLAVIVAGAGLARWAFTRMGMPGVVGEILLGVALGPSLLGWLSPAAREGLFPESGKPILEALSWVGLVLFVLQVGLEMRWRRDQTTPMLRTATGGLVVPLAVGMGLPMAFPSWFFPGPGAFKADLLVGIVLTVSALPVLARILEDLGRQRSALGALVLAAATLDDVIGWVLLALVSAVGAGVGYAAFATGLVIAGGFAALLLLSERMARTRLDALKKPSRPLFVGVLSLTFGAGALTQAAGLNAVLGPLAVGAALSSHAIVRDDVVERLRHVTRILLLPIFFVVSGAAVDLRLLPLPESLVPLLVVLLAASAAKIVGCALGARMAGVPWREGLGMGSLLNARGAVGLVVVKVGLDSGILSHAGYSLLVLVVALTTMASPILGKAFLGPDPARDASPG
ncbi:MAG: cation:proton antiporter [Thermoplasmatota archaeon]|nr:cation:proton antiporter [Halobacteriales archaeon]